MALPPVGEPQPTAAAPVAITVEHVREANPRRGLTYDKSGDMHYDVISAFIKSMRGSDPDAALYWLARMIDAGEDPKFIARRIFILASEDIGNADPQAILVAEAAFNPGVAENISIRRPNVKDHVRIAVRDMELSKRAIIQI